MKKLFIFAGLVVVMVVLGFAIFSHPPQFAHAASPTPIQCTVMPPATGSFTYTFVATGGNGSSYLWTAPFDTSPTTGSGSQFQATFDSAGTYNIEVLDVVDNISGSCQVTVPGSAVSKGSASTIGTVGSETITSCPSGSAPATSNSTQGPCTGNPGQSCSDAVACANKAQVEGTALGYQISCSVLFDTDNPGPVDPYNPICTVDGISSQNAESLAGFIPSAGAPSNALTVGPGWSGLAAQIASSNAFSQCGGVAQSVYTTKLVYDPTTGRNDTVGIWVCANGSAVVGGTATPPTPVSTPPTASTTGSTIPNTSVSVNTGPATASPIAGATTYATIFGSAVNIINQILGLIYTNTGPVTSSPVPTNSVVATSTSSQLQVLCKSLGY